MKVHSELYEAIRKAQASLDEAIRIIELEKDSAEEDDLVFESANGFILNMLETSDFSAELIQDEATRLALGLIRAVA